MIALLLTMVGGEALAATRVDLRCRARIANNFRHLVRNSLTHVDACHAQARKGATLTACNQLANAPAYTRAQARARGIINAFCVVSSPVLQNYPLQGSDVATVVTPALRTRLESSAASLEGLQSLSADRTTARAQRRCLEAIGRARTRAVTEIVGEAIRCQKKLDAHAAVLGEISPTCLGGPSARTLNRAGARIAHGCAGVRGADVGSCDPLPACVFASATATAHAVARDIYGALPSERGALCGNGVIDAGEECDDGNTDNGDGCTDKCTKARCGDGIVETGVEECDDGNNVDTDACTPQCRKARCGDGIVETGVEECDDGNDVPGDGCTNCRFDEVTCPTTGGVRVMMTLVPNKDGSTQPNITGLKVELAYPSDTSLPGSGVLPVDDPSDPATRIVLLDQSLYAGLIIFNDTDTSLLTTIAPPSAIVLAHSYPFERVTFDCSSGAVLRPTDFACTVPDESGPLGVVVPGTCSGGSRDGGTCTYDQGPDPDQSCPGGRCDGGGQRPACQVALDVGG
jgi:cysteine-rich repeat protein